MTIHLLILTGLIFYIINYLIGWLLYYKIISMKKRTHQIFFAAIIINLGLILIFVTLNFAEIMICSLSLAAMFMLPLGKKAGIYHRVVSSAGLILFVMLFVLQFKK